jgi:hypothetical protein
VLDKIKNFFWDILIVKWLWKQLWLINIIVGLLFAELLSEYLPLKGLSHRLNQIIYGFAFLFITEFVKIIFRVPNQVSTNLSKFQNVIATTYYKGFYTLLSNNKDFEKLEKGFSDASGADSPLKGVLLDFIVSSLASIGRNGFTMVDAGVDVYVKYISQVVEKCNDIRMTCVVRPYWFVVDEIGDVTLPPYKKEQDKYGKGEHLRFFEKNNGKYQRIIIVDEPMLAEMFLTAYIDKYFVEKVNMKCPLCMSHNDVCPFHNDSNRISISDIDDIPEIYWFKKYVNEERGVDLIYTLIRAERRKRHRELDDRIYVENPALPLDIRFNFINLEKGILKITWGESECQRLVRINIEQDKAFREVDPLAGTREQIKHKFYKHFKYIIKDELRVKMIGHLRLLQEQLEKLEQPGKGFSMNVKDKISDATVRNLYADGDQRFHEEIIKATKELIKVIINKDKSLLSIYEDLIKHNKNTIPKVAYVVTYDPLHLEWPLRVARWEFNWKGILNAA